MAGAVKILEKNIVACYQPNKSRTIRRCRHRPVVMLFVQFEASARTFGSSDKSKLKMLDVCISA